MKVCQYLLEKEFRHKIFAFEGANDKKTQLITNLESVYKFSDKINRDMLYHVSFVVYLLNSEIKGPEYRYSYFDVDSLGIENDCAKIAIVSKIGAFLNFEKKADLKDKLITFRGQKFTLFDQLQESCSTNQLNLKQSAFRVLKDACDKIAKNDFIFKQYQTDKELQKNLFQLIMQNWEFPIRGFANNMEDVFSNYLSLFPTEQDKLALMKQIVSEFPSNSRRKFASLKLILRGVDIDEFLKISPTIVSDLLQFEKLGGSAFVVQLFKEILNQAFNKMNKKHPKDKTAAIKEWTDFWIQDYIEVVINGTTEIVEDLNEYVNPQIFSICEKSLPIVISKLFSTTQKSTVSFQSVQASLLRFARSKDIFVCEDNTWKLKGIDEQTTVDWNKFIEEIICHSNRHIALDAIKTVLEPKKDSLNPQPVEYQLLQRALIYDTKNSYPDFRNDMSVTIKRFLHRLRNNFSPCFKKITSDETFQEFTVQDLPFQQFVDFMTTFKTTLLRETYPDAPYESVYPLLESVRVIYDSFNENPFYFRKKTRFDG